MKLEKQIFIAVLCFQPWILQGSCHHEEHEHEVHWTKKKSETVNIRIETAGPGTIEHYADVPGKVAVHPDCIAYVIPKVSGAVKDIRKNVGECVKKDEVIALLESKEIAEAKSQHIAAIKKFDLYKTLLEREVSLKGISPEKDYLNAKLAMEEALIHADLTKQSLYALGLTEAEVERIPREKKTELRFYEIRSPIEGKVLQRNVTLGELISDTNKIYTIVDCKKVWVEIHVNQNTVQHLKVGLPIEIFATNEKKAASAIHQFHPLICEETRCATAFAMIENTLEKWTPGEFVTVKILTNTFQSPLVIPKTALQKMKGENVIFIANKEKFTPRAIILGKSDAQNVEVLDGLEHGEEYAACNTFILKAELEKEEAEHNH